MKKAHFLAISLAALACLTLVSSTVAEEPVYASVALLFDSTAIEQGCLEDGVVLVFGGQGEGGLTEKSLGAPGFGEFGSSNLFPVSAKYVTKGAVRERVAYQIGDRVLPRQGVMLLGPGGDFQIEFCGFVSESGNTFEPDDDGDRGLVIITGLVR